MKATFLSKIILLFMVSLLSTTSLSYAYFNPNIPVEDSPKETIVSTVETPIDDIISFDESTSSENTESSKKDSSFVVNKKETVAATNIKINKKSLSLRVKENFRLSVIVTPVESANKFATWKSSNSGVATVDQEGYVLAVGVGSTTITASTANGLSAKCSVTVLSPAINPTSINLSQKSLSLNIGKSKVVTATVLPVNATNKTITWMSVNPNIAEVSSGNIVGKSVGTTTILATTVNGLTNMVNVSVTAPTTSSSIISTSTNISSSSNPQSSSQQQSESSSSSNPDDNKPSLLKGIDVSVHQGTINWAAVKADGVDFVMIRAGFGNCLYDTNNPGEPLQVDRRFGDNIEGALKNGIKVGVYWYSYALTPAEAVLEANACLEVLTRYGITPNDLDYPVAFDIEDPSQNSTARKTINTQIAIAFCDTIKAAGYTPAVYTYLSFFKNCINYSSLSDYHIWYAQYPSSVTDPMTGSSAPSDLKIDIWQYTDSASISGISGNVDANYGFTNFDCNVGLKKYYANVEKKTCNTNKIAVRRSANDTSSSNGTINYGTSMKIIFYWNDWAYVRTDNGIDGFIKTKYLQ